MKFDLNDKYYIYDFNDFISWKTETFIEWVKENKVFSLSSIEKIENKLKEIENKKEEEDILDYIAEFFDTNWCKSEFTYGENEVLSFYLFEK